MNDNQQNTQTTEQQTFLREQQDYNSQKKPQEQPDLCKVEHLEVLDI